ncbi:hypothetical protein HD_0162 [[Haemophilus] ducreyi 35000HP]|uniref:Uncharacterized protein n=1 Tax=Haemophilus ducreyi (strain 35000HP / ATCC 700724) TaxID=233412 RepID=Q7VPC4_HAEDU|nr:hypothetical protein HD_0162 [[Haemophilus] ducreyi 35000HP]
MAYLWKIIEIIRLFLVKNKAIESKFCKLFYLI